MPSEFERQVATVIYHAALLFHEKALFQNSRITVFSYKELEKHFSQMLDMHWLTPGLIGLCKKA